MQLYKIDDAIRQAIEIATDPETGELLSIDEIEELMTEKSNKIENIACWIKNLKSDLTALKAERDTFNQRIKQTQNKLDSLTHYLEFCLNGDKFESEKCKISYRRSESVEIKEDNLTAFIQWAEANNDSCLRYKAPEVDKTIVKELINRGEDVPYASIVSKLNMQIK